MLSYSVKTFHVQDPRRWGFLLSCSPYGRDTRTPIPSNLPPRPAESTGSTQPGPWSSWKYRLSAALMSARWLNACGKLPSCRLQVADQAVLTNVWVAIHRNVPSTHLGFRLPLF